MSLVSKTKNASHFYLKKNYKPFLFSNTTFSLFHTPSIPPSKFVVFDFLINFNYLSY
jgi:hypothetical protein